MCANEPAVGGSPEPVTAVAPAGRRLAAVRAISIAVATALLSGAAPARAACRFTGATGMTFTGYSPVGAGVAATTTLSYRCSGFTFFATLAITPTTRAMTSGPETLPFELYTDAARTTVFPGSPAMNLPIVANGTVTVYGFVGPRDVGVGTYTRALTATITNNGLTTRTTTFTATAVVAGDCTIEPATLAFGAYDPLVGTPRDATGTLSIACTRGTPYTVALDAGAHAAGGTRRMAGPGGGLLQYELYSDVARIAPWAPSTLVGDTAQTAAAIAVPVYGRIPPGQLVQAGDYTDVVQSTVNF